MNKFLSLHRLLLPFLVLSGCTPGWIYTDITEPYCTDMHSTKTGEARSTAGLKSISIPRVPGARTVWSSNAIADAAKREGIDELEYCDRERYSILGGLWGNDSIVVYGWRSKEE